MSIWENIPSERDNAPFWICYHAVMLWLHGAISKADLDTIFEKYTIKSHE